MERPRRAFSGRTVSDGGSCSLGSCGLGLSRTTSCVSGLLGDASGLRLGNPKDRLDELHHRVLSPISAQRLASLPNVPRAPSRARASRQVEQIRAHSPVRIAEPLPVRSGQISRLSALFATKPS